MQKDKIKRKSIIKKKQKKKQNTSKQGKPTKPHAPNLANDIMQQKETRKNHKTQF